MLKPIRLIPHGTKIDFIGKRKLWLALSMLLIVASIVSVGVRGLNFGIDFSGGILVEIKTQGPANIGFLRDRLNGLGIGGVELQGVGAADDELMIRVQRQPGGDAAQAEALRKVKESLGGNVEVRRTEVVGPKVGDELIFDGVLALSLAILAIAAYVAFRFEWYYGVGAMLSLIHDIFTTVGIFSLLGLEFNLTTVAALLTIAGYSINDTVVVYDRVRENLRKYKKMKLGDLMNLSLNETLSRTILTSGTTMLSVVAIFLFGGDVLRGFAFAMIWGIAVGTFSSIYIALPVLLQFNIGPDQSARDGTAEAQGEDGEEGDAAKKDEDDFAPAPAKPKASAPAAPHSAPPKPAAPPKKP